MSTWMLRVGHFDHVALLAVVNRRRPWLDAVMRYVTHLGSAPFMIGTAVILAIFAGPQLSDAGAISAFALAASHAGVQLLKRTVARPRPSLPAGIGSLIAAPDRFSFPSGHSAATLSVALPVAMTLAAPLATALMAMALAVGLSRCYLGVHYPGDVLVGWALAIVAVLPAPAMLLMFGLL